MNTIADVWAKCIVEPPSRCWLWRGAGWQHDRVRIYTIDYNGKTKRTMSGPIAMWNIAYGESPPSGRLVYRACGQCLCLNPEHLRLARGQGDLMRAISRSGRWKGTNLEQRRTAAARGRIAQGMRDTPEHVVREILAAEGSNFAVAKRLGVHHSVVSRARLGQTHKTIERPTKAVT